MTDMKYIPALGYDWLTGFYDSGMRLGTLQLFKAQKQKP